MKENSLAGRALVPSDVFLAEDSTESPIPICLVSDSFPVASAGLGEAERRWLEATGFTTAARKQALVPGAGGKLAAAALGLGNGASGEPSGPSELLVGLLASSLPAGAYALPDACAAPELAALAWGLGAYRFRRYKTTGGNDAPPRLKVPAGVDRQALLATVEAVWLGRDLINTPASDLGPDELEAAARDLAVRYGAKVTVVKGEKLLEERFSLIHAVGRGSPRTPRLIDLKWQKPGGSANAPTVTLVGKGITFDTGGLDIKPASAMLLMKKDMGGAATALSLGHMIMGQGLDVKLRLLIAAAENSVSGRASGPAMW